MGTIGEVRYLLGGQEHQLLHGKRRHLFAAQRLQRTNSGGARQSKGSSGPGGAATGPGGSSGPGGAAMVLNPETKNTSAGLLRRGAILDTRISVSHALGKKRLRSHSSPNGRHLLRATDIHRHKKEKHSLCSG